MYFIVLGGESVLTNKIAHADTVALTAVQTLHAQEIRKIVEDHQHDDPMTCELMF